MRNPFSMLLVAVLCAACSSAPTVDHANPYLLNEAAVREVQAGGFAAAEILLERAVLLAPHETPIRRNRDLLRGFRAGLHALPQLTIPETEIVPAQKSIPDTEPPAPLWPAK